MKNRAAWGWLELLPLPALALDAEARVRAANLHAQEALGIGARRLWGTPAVGIFAPEDEVRRWLARGRDAPAFSQALSAMGRPIAAWIGPDEEGGWIAVFAEETARRAFEELVVRREKAEAIARMALELAHEVKNPLAALSGVAQWLAEKAQDPMLAEGAERLVRETERVRARVDALLQLGPRAPAPLEWVNLHRLIDEVSAGAPGGVRVRRVFDPALPEVHAARARLRQALENLWRNALEASPSWIEWRTSANPLVRPPGVSGPVV
ncbi:MAG: two-component sensor histidine kinase, partial [Zetaproteobacteria bacterium]